MKLNKVGTSFYDDAIKMRVQGHRLVGVQAEIDGEKRPEETEQKTVVTNDDETLPTKTSRENSSVRPDSNTESSQL